jgi:hypothetical protein
MKKIVVLFLFAAASLVAFGEVTGHAFLQNQTDHSGVKIKFIPISPTAVLDSTYTIADGSYSKSIEPGVYYVIFSKTGYETVQYNDGNPVVITVNYILSDITLQEGGSFIYLSGNVDGILTSENVYIVTDDITIPEFQMLYIEPGTLIKLQEGCNINVYGVLEAIGTEVEKIVFTSAEDTPSIDDWGSLRFYYGAYDTCFLKNCKVEYGYGIFVESLTIIESCELCYLGTAINTHFGDNSHFINNNIHDFSGIGINIDNTYYLKIKNNTIALNGQPTGSYFCGIQAYSSNGIIESNYIYCVNNQLAEFNEGIYSYSSHWQIYNNIVNHCKYGFYGGSDQFYIGNNIFSNNSIAGILAGGSNYNECIIQSNIIFNNAIGFTSYEGTDQIDFSYNNVWGNNINYDSQIPGIGQIIATNNNGDPCDPYYNITLDPLFIDAANMDFHVIEDSPVIDAGIDDYVTPIFDLDGLPRIMDGNNDGVAIVDMGVYEFIDSLLLISDFTCPDSACTDTYVTIEYLGTPIEGTTYHWYFDGGVIGSGSGQGPYYVKWQQTGSKTISLFLSFDNVNSDTTYHNIQIDQTVASSVTISASLNPVCIGSEVVFTAIPVFGGDSPTFQWKLNGQNVGTNSPVYINSNLQSGNMVYCYLTTSEGCPDQPAVVSNIIVMTVYQYPNVSIASSPNDTTCITETITLNAGNPGCEYIWSTGESTQSIIVSNNSGPSGGLQDYTVEVIKGGICSGYDTISVYFDPCTGIHDFAETSGIRVFPNPSTQDFYIQINNTIYPVTVSLISSQGNILNEFVIYPSQSNDPLKIEMTDTQHGIYFLKFQNEEIFEVRKIIRQ